MFNTLSMHREDSHIPIKILNGYNMDLAQHSCIWELEALKQLSSPMLSVHCLKLISNFTIPDKGSVGEHLHLVTQHLGRDINSLHEKHCTVFSLPLAKWSLLHVLCGIVHVHSCGMMHTNLKHDNLFFDACMSAEILNKILVSDPPHWYPPKAPYDRTVKVAVLQPLPTLPWKKLCSEIMLWLILAVVMSPQILFVIQTAQ